MSRKGMPHYKHQWDHVLTWPEVEGYIKKAESIGIPKHRRLQCIIALAWIFGKRIHEILKLTKEDFTINGENMEVRFRVGKKRKKKQGPIVTTYPKKINMKHPAVKYVLPWLEKIERGYIFPSSRLRRVVRKYHEEPTEFSTRFYFYVIPGGYVAYETVWDQLKKLDERLFWHLFRHSLATQMGAKYGDAMMLKSWFDWENLEQAATYVHLEQAHIDKMSKRTDF